MKTLHPSFKTVAAMLLALSAASMSHAVLPVRTFVASTGSDVNPCSRTSPCRTFGAAIAAVAGSGDVIVLDSAGYGPVSINKSVSLYAPPSNYAGVTPNAGADAVDINITPADSVTLKGLTLSGLGTGLNGIYDINFATNTTGPLFVENCEINGFTTAGINFNVAGQVSVKDTNIRNCVNPNGPAPYGIAIGIGGANQSYGSIDHCRLEHNGVGLYATTNSRVTVRDSVAAFNTAEGFLANGAVISDITRRGELNIENCLVTGNGQYGVLLNGGLGIIRVSNSTITDNVQYGVYAPGCSTGPYAPCSSLLTRQNNTLEGNGPNGTFGGTFSPQ